MEALLAGVFVSITFLALLQAVLIGVQTWEHRRFARNRLQVVPHCAAKGRALLVVPCRGNEPGLEDNLRSVLCQDYEDYEVRFVVESGHDPAYRVILQAMAAHPGTQARVIVAGQATASGQKVHNLLAATAGLPDDVEYLAFADSDALLRPDWLRALVSRLDEPGIAAATGYRWFVPSRPTLAGHVVYSLNACVAMFLGKNPPTVVWGGSWAIRRGRFESLGLRGAWEGMLDEDLVAGDVFRRAGLRVAFEPACMVSTPLDGSPGELLAFARRQFFLTRFYSPLAWRLVFLSVTLANAAFWGNLAAAVWGLAGGPFSPWAPAAAALALYLLGAGGGLVRHNVAGIYFPHLGGPLRKARRFEIWSGPLVLLANWLVVAASGLGREVRWRNIAYRLARDGRIAAIRRQEPLLSGPHWRRRNDADCAEPPQTCRPGAEERDEAGVAAPAMK